MPTITELKKEVEALTARLETGGHLLPSYRKYLKKILLSLQIKELRAKS